MSLSVSLSFEQKVAYAERCLGINVQNDSRELFDFVQSMLEKPLPVPWRQCFDEHWRLFYYNERTKISVWSHPLESAHVHLVEAYRRIEAEASTLQSELRHLRALAEAESAKWSEAEADGRTFFFHVEEPRRATWENPREVIMANLAFEVEMIGQAFPKMEVATHIEHSPEMPEEVVEEMRRSRELSYASSQSGRHRRPSRATDEEGHNGHNRQQLRRQQATLLISVARRWLCQLDLARRYEALRRLQGCLRAWLYTAALSRMRQSQARDVMICFLRRWLAWQNLLDLGAEGSVVDSVYSSDYEPESQSRCSPMSAGGQEENTATDRNEVSPQSYISLDASSLGRMPRWEGVSSPHWRSHLEIPPMKIPEFKELQAPLKNFELEANSFISGLGRDSKGFEHLLEAAKAQLPNRRHSKALQGHQHNVPVLRCRRKLQRIGGQDFHNQAQGTVSGQTSKLPTSELQRLEPAAVPVGPAAAAASSSVAAPRKSSEVPESEGAHETPTASWEQRVLESLAAQSPKHAEAKRRNSAVASYALKEFAQAEKAKELKRTLRPRRSKDGARVISRASLCAL